MRGRQALCQRCNRIWNISRFAVIHGEYICPKCTKRIRNPKKLLIGTSSSQHYLK